MCGIIGWSKGGIDEAELRRFEAATAMLSHRGPDAQAIRLNGNVLLGHTRLMIVDLTTAAHQPMESGDGLTITYNGEIYNHLHLRNTLRQYGHVFSTSSDTEVLLKAYRQWGQKMVDKIDGMFSFCIYDEKEECLFLARDPLGKKPLYYSVGKDQSFLFASEIKPILSLMEDTPQRDEEALHQFLALGYILHPHTPYAAIRQLHPGSTLTYYLRSGREVQCKYFKVIDFFRHKHQLPFKETSEALRDALEKAVAKRLMGDVPGGVFLSGGLDSALILALIRKTSGEKFAPFHFSFKEEKYDESVKAKAVANWLKYPLQIVDQGDDPALEFSRLLDEMDHIPADNAIFPLYLLSKQAVKEVKFVLTGDGADELLGGYATYRADYWNKRFRQLVPALKTIMKVPGYHHLENINDGVGLLSKLTRFIRGIDSDYRKAHYQWRMIFSMEERLKFFGSEKAEWLLETDPCRQFEKYYQEAADLDESDQHAYVDIQTWLVDDILVKTDRATMHCGPMSLS